MAFVDAGLRREVKWEKRTNLSTHQYHERTGELGLNRTSSHKAVKKSYIEKVNGDAARRLSPRRCHAP
jgi:hypothetical protein